MARGAGSDPRVSVAALVLCEGVYPEKDGASDGNGGESNCDVAAESVVGGAGGDGGGVGGGEKGGRRWGEGHGDGGDDGVGGTAERDAGEGGQEVVRGEGMSRARWMMASDERGEEE